VGLVDHLAYRDEVYAAVRKLVTGTRPAALANGSASSANGTGEPELLYLARYQRSKELASKARQFAAPRQNVVAMISATGAIRRGRSGRGVLPGGAVGADSITAALRAASLIRT
jgi:ClpP class serine protease